MVLAGLHKVVQVEVARDERGGLAVRLVQGQRLIPLQVAHHLLEARALAEAVGKRLHLLLRNFARCAFAAEGPGGAQPPSAGSRRPGVPLPLVGQPAFAEPVVDGPRLALAGASAAAAAGLAEPPEHLRLVARLYGHHAFYTRTLSPEPVVSRLPLQHAYGALEALLWALCISARTSGSGCTSGCTSGSSCGSVLGAVHSPFFGSGKLEYYFATRRPALEARGVDAVANLHRCYLRQDPFFLRSLLRLVGRKVDRRFYFSHLLPGSQRGAPGVGLLARTSCCATASRESGAPSHSSGRWR